MTREYGKLLEYLKYGNISNIPVHVSFSYLSYGQFKKMKSFFDTIFNKLNLIQIKFFIIGDKSLSQLLCKKIARCNSLRFVEFAIVSNVEAQLECMRKNTSVKQWKFESDPQYLTKNDKKTLKQLILRRNDNSIYVSDDDNSCNIPEITQLFDIKPIL